MAGREEIVQQALGLPPEDRALVAAILQHSLTPDSGDSPASGVGEISAAGDFLGELQRRSAAWRAGATTARSAADVVADLLRRQSAQSGQ
jgi:hypothetical protein